jgi:hypothetical protein
MKAFKIKEDTLKDRIVIELLPYHIMVATPTEGTRYISYFDYKKYITQADEIELEDEWRLKPHWSKKIREFLK